ncbi:hypothetical protein EVAR_61762_1 [Eumeta japonica]|uniref:Uncharacterized protein n=1 Tax=Eumeta variegata TaxID=151549 RepID=A0A4C1ZG30_EUMVA|nr:hypothetical protein EVAR_61762_1 [Eumeta japonica]
MAWSRDVQGFALKTVELGGSFIVTANCSGSRGSSHRKKVIQRAQYIAKRAYSVKAQFRASQPSGEPGRTCEAVTSQAPRDLIRQWSETIFQSLCGRLRRRRCP